MSPTDPFDGIAIDAIAAPPEALFTQARWLARQRSLATSSEPNRYRVALEGIVCSLDSDFRPVGRPCKVVVAEFSPKMVRFFHTRHLPGQLFALRFQLSPLPGATLALTVTNVEPSGRYYIFTGDFLARLDERAVPRRPFRIASEGLDSGNDDSLPNS